MINEKFVTYRVQRYKGGPSIRQVEATPRVHPAHKKQSTDSDEQKQFQENLDRQQDKQKKDSQLSKKVAFKSKDVFTSSVPKPSPNQDWVRSIWENHISTFTDLDLKKIVLAYDGADVSYLAMQSALRLAWHFRATLHVVVVTSAKEEEMPKIVETIQEDMRSVLDVASLIQPPQIEILPEGDLVGSIDDYLSEVHANLFVMGSHCRRGVDKVLWGSVAETAIHKIYKPTLIVCGERTQEQIQKILVPVDGTDFGYQAINQALLLCHEFDAELVLFHVPETELKNADQKIQGMMNELNWKGVHHDFLSGSGDISLAIAECVKNESIDLILMGTHVRDNYFDKSVTAEVIEQSPCSVWVIHPEMMV